MNIIIPMAGNGQRFIDSHFTLPKPLIPIAGKAMYRYAVDGLPLTMASRLIFVIRDDQYADDLKKEICQHYGHYDLYIHSLSHVTRGQAETVLTCESFIDLNKPTLIHNCDTQIADDLPWHDIIHYGDEPLRKESYAGCVVLFSSNQRRWSYVQLDESKSRITDMREKEVISHYASSGTYYFQNTKQLIHDIRDIIDKDIREGNEYYLSTVYSRMIQQGHIIVPLFSKLLFCYGTPQDLVNSMNAMLTNTLPDFIDL